MAPFIAAIVFMGVYPKPVIERIEPAVDAIIAHVEDNVPASPSRSPTCIPP